MTRETPWLSYFRYQTFIEREAKELPDRTAGTEECMEELWKSQRKMAQKSLSEPFVL
jgi:hypothetical protein